MRILITGICGFLGRKLAEGLLDSIGGSNIQIVGVDNLIRSGSWLNRDYLIRRGIEVIHGDIRNSSDVEPVGPVDWVIDAAAIPTVLAGLTGHLSSRQLVEHNLVGTINLLEHCKAYGAGFTLLSTSRVYEIRSLAALEFSKFEEAFSPLEKQLFPAGLSVKGIAEGFSTSTPISLYGATKLASETIALEYGSTFNFPVWINRCGVLAGAGQFASADQGIFSYWIQNWQARNPLTYIGFDGSGRQVRDCLHPLDLVPLIRDQMEQNLSVYPRIFNFGGGVENSMSLKQLSQWCYERFGPNEVKVELNPRKFDLPWIVMDSSLAKDAWNWHPKRDLEFILDEIAYKSGLTPE